MNLRKSADSHIVPRKNPRQKRSAVMVDDILEAAARILEAEGPAGMSTNKVATRAGVSVGSLYQYFPNKDALTAALIHRAHEDVVDGLAQIVAETEGLPSDEALAAVIAFGVNLQLGRPRLSRVLDVEEERLPKPESLLALEREIDRLNYVFIARFAKPGLSEGEVAQAATDMVSIMRGMLDGAVTTTDYEAVGLHQRVHRTLKGYLSALIV